MPDYQQLLLQPNRPLRLDAARHVELRVDCGMVWITASGVAGDVFLSAGAGYRLPRGGKTLVEAVRGPAGVSLSAPQPRLLALLVEHCRNPLPRAFTRS